MDGSLIVSLIALGVSAISLGMSTILTFRQVQLLRNANHLPVILNLLTEFRKANFHDNYRYVIERLRIDHDPAQGISSLSGDARAALLDVAYYFQTYASLEGFGVLRNRQMSIHLNYRAIHVWSAIKPFVEAERENPSGADRWMLIKLQTHVEKLAKQGLANPQ